MGALGCVQLQTVHEKPPGLLNNAKAEDSMKEIYVNLKRFEVPKEHGRHVPLENPVDWMRQVIHETAEYGLGNSKAWI